MQVRARWAMAIAGVLLIAAIALVWGQGHRAEASAFPGQGATNGQFPGGGATGGTFPPDDTGAPADPCLGDPEVAACQAVAANCQQSCLARGTPFFTLVIDHAIEDWNPCEPLKKVFLSSCTVVKDHTLCIDVICSCDFCTE